MRAFILSMIAMVVITIAAAFALDTIPMSAKDVYTSSRNVRL